MKVVVVGEAPSRVMREGDPPLLLARHELASLCGVGLEEFLKVFELRNVLGFWPGRNAYGKGDAFPLREARAAAQKMRFEQGQEVVLLGRRVAQAFHLPQDLEYFASSGRFTLAPHPSKVSRWWNVMSNRIRARQFWRMIHARAQQEDQGEVAPG